VLFQHHLLWSLGELCVRVCVCVCVRERERVYVLFQHHLRWPLGELCVYAWERERMFFSLRALLTSPALVSVWTLILFVCVCVCESDVYCCVLFRHYLRWSLGGLRVCVRESVWESVCKRMFSSLRVLVTSPALVSRWTLILCVCVCVS